MKNNNQSTISYPEKTTDLPQVTDKLNHIITVFTSKFVSCKNHPTYSTQFKKIYGNNIFDNTDKAYLAMTKSIAEFEKTKFFAPILLP
jgi:hypothetical protein